MLEFWFCGVTYTVSLPLYRWCTVVSATFRYDEHLNWQYVTWGCDLSIDMSVEVHHIWLSYDQLWAASLIGGNAVMWHIIIEWWTRHGRLCIVAMTMHHCKLAWLMIVNMQCITAVLIMKKATVSKSQNVKDSSHANKYLRKIKINLWTKVEICISTYSNADVMCYSATWRTELNGRNST